MDAKELLEEIQKDIADLFLLNERMAKVNLPKKFQVDRARQKAKALILAYDNLSEMLNYDLVDRHLQLELQLAYHRNKLVVEEAKKAEKATDELIVDETPELAVDTMMLEEIENETLNLEEELLDESEILIAQELEELPEEEMLSMEFEESSMEEELPVGLVNLTVDEHGNLQIGDDAQDIEVLSEGESLPIEIEEEEEKLEEEDSPQKDGAAAAIDDAEEEQPKVQEEEPQEESAANFNNLNLGKILNSPVPEDMKLEYELDNYQESVQSLDDLLNTTSSKNQPNDAPIRRLIEAIGLNERFDFIADLFDNKTDQFYHTVQTIDQMYALEDAEKFLKEEFNWHDSEIKKQFMNLVKRRFL